MTKPQLFHCLRYSDAQRAVDFLTGLGFTEKLLVRDENDGAIIQHAQLDWRDNGGVMLGSRRDDDLAGYFGASTANLVVDSDDEVDELVAWAVANGASIVREPENPPHGGRTGAFADFDGNLWSIDSYQGT